MKILAISGSTRKQSYNTMLLKHIASILPNHEVEVITLNEIPIFNQDIERNSIQSIDELKTKARNADAIIIATPEYNNMIPGVLKNCIEWLTRDYDNILENKWLAIVGCSDGGFGTVRAQLQLMNLAQIVGMRTLGKFRFPVSKAQDKFDTQGNLIDAEVKEKLEVFIKKYIDFLQLELNV